MTPSRLVIWSLKVCGAQNSSLYLPCVSKVLANPCLITSTVPSGEKNRNNHENSRHNVD